jgi:hypothetical protein
LSAYASTVQIHIGIVSFPYLLYAIYFMARDDPFRAGSRNHQRMWENYLSDENGFWLVAQISAFPIVSNSCVMASV